MKQSLLLLAALIAAVFHASALPLPSAFHFSFHDGTLSIQARTNSSLYYLLEETSDLETFHPQAIEGGAPPPLWEIPATNAYRFFLVTPISIYAPRFTLGDGIDDVFKLSYGLDPLDAGVASGDSGFTGAGGARLSWLQYYRRFDRSPLSAQSHGRELSVFNAGAASARFEAVSREVSMNNGDLLPGSFISEAYGREVSIFNAGYSGLQAVSREFSVLNEGERGPLDAVSRELSLYNGEALPPSAILEAYSREMTVFHAGHAVSAGHSREFSVFTDILN